VASPVARKIAEAAGVPLVRVRGTGANGRIKRRDVEAAIRDRGGVPMPDGAESGTVRDGLLAVYRSGPADAGAPVVMLHGFAADAMMWHPVEQALAARHPVVRLDLPCHGRSPRPRVGGFRQFARLVTEAVRTLDAGPVHLVGHSLGGAVAVAVAEAMPFGVRSLTLLAPAGLGAEIDGAVLRGLCQAGRVESLAPWLRRMVVDQTLIGDDYARAAMALRADPGLREAQADLADVLFPDGTQSFNLSRTLRAVRAPTRIVWGRADDVIPWQHALSAPGTVALHLPPAIGHLAHIEMPDLVVAVIEAQVEAAEAGAGDGTGAGNHGSWRAGAPASVPEVREAHHA
jgi:pyruvate dehydrogenase E2 component (dihydrolipoamide acetyltransferase)